MTLHPASIAHQVLSIVPQSLGFIPENSLVLATYRLSGRQLTMGPLGRFTFSRSALADLDAVDLFRHAEQMAVLAPGGGPVMPVLYTAEMLEAVSSARDEEEPDDSLYSAYAVPLKLVCDALTSCGFLPDDPWWVGAGRYGFVPSCDIAGPVSELESTSAARQLRAAGFGPVADQTAAAGLLTPDPKIERAVEATRAVDHPLAALFDAVLQEALRFWKLHADGTPHSADEMPHPDPLAVVGLEVMCTQKWSRDAVQMLVSFQHPDFLPEDMAQLAPGEFIRHARRHGASFAAADRMPGISELQPAQSLIYYGVGFLKAVTTYADFETMPTLYAMMAWQEWTAARFSFAERYARNALSFDSGLGLASTVLQAVEAGLGPAWVRRAMAEHSLMPQLLSALDDFMADACGCADPDADAADSGCRAGRSTGADDEITGAEDEICTDGGCWCAVDGNRDCGVDCCCSCADDEGWSEGAEGWMAAAVDAVFAQADAPTTRPAQGTVSHLPAGGPRLSAAADRKPRGDEVPDALPGGWEESGDEAEAG